MALSRLDQRYGSAVRGVWNFVLGRVIRSFADAGSWRDADAARFQRQALPIILAGERQVATLTASYLEQLYRDQDDEVHRVAVDLDAVTGTALRGVDPREVYERPYTQIYTALSKGDSLDEAVRQGTHRLETLVKTDLQLARTHTVREVAADMPRVTYTVRELQGEYDCALCMIASTQRYHKRDLAPIHPGCDCLVKVVTADYDPGQVIDEDLLNAIHDAVEEATGTSDRGGRAVDYRKILLTREHGEIGPVLTFRDQHFTGPDDVPHPAGRSPSGDGNQPPADPPTPDSGDGRAEPLGASIYDGVDVEGKVPPGHREREALDHAIDAIARVHGMDRQMPPIPLVSEDRPGMLGLYVRTRGGHPIRFALNPDGPWPELTAVHELGHFLDHVALGEALDVPATETEIGEGGLLHEWWTAVQSTAAYQVLAFLLSQPDETELGTVERDGIVQTFATDRRYIEYLMSPVEMFGRAYAQWIATASDDVVLRDELDQAADPALGGTLISGVMAGYPRQWSDEDFAPVADAFANLFRRLGLLNEEGS